MSAIETISGNHHRRNNVYKVHSHPSGVTETLEETERCSANYKAETIGLSALIEFYL